MNHARRYWLAGVAGCAVTAGGALFTVGLLPRPRAFTPKRHLVEISAVAFHPEVLEITRGDTVVWVNQDLVPHTATAEAKAGWSSQLLNQGDSARFAPREKGEWRYICKFHPTMHGRVIVR